MKIKLKDVLEALDFMNDEEDVALRKESVFCVFTYASF